jgi:steroid delta-isomerase-like uncharacterized protein
MAGRFSIAVEVIMIASDENKAIVRRLVEEAQGGGQLDVIDELMSSDFVDHCPVPGIPATREGVKQIFGMFHAALPDLHVTIHDQIAEADRVMTRKTLSGTHQGDLFGIPPTGKAVDIHVIDILRLCDGRITDHWNLVDQQGLLQQLGMAPVAAEA